MVSIDENNVEAAAQALKGVASDILEAARAASWMRPAPERPAEPSGFAEAAVAYLHDAPAPAEKPATLTLVSDSNEPKTKDVEAAQLEEARAAAIDAVKQQLEEAFVHNDVPAQTRLKAVLQSLKTATSLAAITSAQSQTSQLSGADKVETAEEKAERLREEIAKIDESLDEKYKRMVASGQMSQETYDAWKHSTEYAAAHPENAAAQTAAQTATENAQTEAERNAKTPDEKNAASATQPLVERRGEAVADYVATFSHENAIPTLEQNVANSNSPTAVTQEPRVVASNLPDLQGAGVTHATDMATNNALPRVATANASVDLG